MSNFLNSLEKITTENFELYLDYNHNLIHTLTTSTYLHKSSYRIKCWNEAFAELQEFQGKELWVFHLRKSKNGISEHIGIIFLIKQRKMGITYWNSAGKLFGSPGPVIRNGFEKKFAHNLLLKLKEDNDFFFMNLAPCIEDWISPMIHNNKIKVESEKLYIEMSIFLDAPYIDLEKHLYPISKKLDSNLIRLKRNLIRDEMEFKHVVSIGSDAKNYLDQLALMHIKEWPKSIFNVGNGVYRDFFEKLTDVNEDLIARIDCLMIENNFAAIVFGIIIKDRYYYLAPSYNEQYKKYSPGSLLIQELLISLEAEGLRIFDFMNSLESYKLKWTSDVQERRKYIVYSNKLLSPNLLYFKARFRTKMKLILHKILAI